MNSYKISARKSATGLVCLIFLISFGCSKSAGQLNPPTDSTGNNNPPPLPVDPQTAATIGFFLDKWQPKTFNGFKDYQPGAAFTGSANATVAVDVNNIITKVSPYLFGNNSNIWMGQMTDQPKLIGHIKDLSPNIIRAPGGSLSDVYFWNQSSAPPADAPDMLPDGDGNSIPAGYWYGENTAGWTLSLDNYYTMLQQTGSTGIITVNYGYARYGTGPDPVAAAAHLAADWVRYDKGRTKFWEIGNENNGNWEAGYRINVSKNQDGQPEIITGKLYGQHWKVFADSMRAAAQQTGATIYIGAQLMEVPPASWQDATNQTWNEGVLKEAGSEADYFIVHDYFTAYNANSTADEILASAVSTPADVMDYLEQQMSQYGVQQKPVAMTEWNIRAVGSRQNVSFIAGVHAAITLGELIKIKFGEASRWDLANGWANGDDMGLFNIGDEPGGVAKWNPRPAFYYLYYFQKYFGDRMVFSTVRGNTDILCYASSFTSGQAGMVIINKGTGSHKVEVKISNFSAGQRYYWFTLTGGNDNGAFSGKVLINGQGPKEGTGGPDNYKDIQAYSSGLENRIKVTVPPQSVIFIIADNDH